MWQEDRIKTESFFFVWSLTIFQLTKAIKNSSKKEKTELLTAAEKQKIDEQHVKLIANSKAHPW